MFSLSLALGLLCTLGSLFQTRRHGIGDIEHTRALEILDLLGVLGNAQAARRARADLSAVPEPKRTVALDHGVIEGNTQVV